jgi:hypothetical protein
MRTAMILCVAGSLAACAGQTDDGRGLISDDCSDVAQRRASGLPPESRAYSARVRDEYDRCVARGGAEPETPPLSYRLFFDRAPERR